MFLRSFQTDPQSLKFPKTKKVSQISTRQCPESYNLDFPFSLNDFGLCKRDILYTLAQDVVIDQIKRSGKREGNCDKKGKGENEKRGKWNSGSRVSRQNELLRRSDFLLYILISPFPSPTLYPRFFSFLLSCSLGLADYYFIFFYGKANLPKGTKPAVSVSQIRIHDRPGISFQFVQHFLLSSFPMTIHMSKMRTRVFYVANAVGNCSEICFHFFFQFPLFFCKFEFLSL